MITRAEVEELGAWHGVEPTMLSLYLAVPPRPALLAPLAARADELIAAAETAWRRTPTVRGTGPGRGPGDAGEMLP